MPIPLLAPVIATIVGYAAKTLTVDTVKFIATRTLIIGVVGTLLPAVLYKLLNAILLELITYAQTQAGSLGSIQGQTVAFSGMGAWVASCLKLPESMAVVMSACALRWVLNAIPFSRI